ncbi:hypothetical protein H1P_110029 [Hyella patelloides LEGE 07179]|uniref:SMODS and SLOG-associating 2TM effector domain-containing protein n=1 Tax=Hyella patelloides LEGE 07179 TaxID=945734 RepID=A0A563VJI3_9CYAN|nr:SLATT domain-containing protein [Hyella patelloides]VEP11579.1 hypothetical protein H1P_110029 [Hyella patelloides LEGE 07179]
MPFKRNNSLKALAIVRCDEYIRIGEKACQENSKLASRWEKTHVSLGLISVFFSIVSTLLAFYHQPLLVAVMTFLAALSTGSLTFFNPTKREIRRKTAESNFLGFVNRIKDFKIAIEYSQLSDLEILNRLDEINSELERLTKELLLSID